MKTRYIMLVLSLLSLMTFPAGGCRSVSQRTESAGQKPGVNKTKTAVWIDTDPSVAPGGHEVDDGFALIQAFHSPELEIRGVSVVFGNAPFDKAWPIGQEIVRRFGPKGLSVFSGAASAEELGLETVASYALAEALRKEKLTILALGPVTNVATMLKNHPDLNDAVTEIIAVAGRRPRQRFLARPEQKIPFRDLNFELDAPGFQVLLDSPVPLTLTPWEISSKVWLKETELKRLAEGNEATRWLHPPAADWLKKWRRDLGLDGFNPFDTLAIGYLTSPQLTRWEELPAEIRILPDDAKQAKQPDGKAEEKPYLLVGGESNAKRKVRYCFDVAPEFKEDLMTRLLRKQ